MADDVFAGAAAPRVAFGASRLGPAASVVRRFVDCVNRRDLAAAAALLADDVLWEDLGDAVPYAGRAQAADLLERTWGAAAEGVTLVVDELSDGAEAAGATWHLEADGRPLPDARGGGFFRLDAGGKIAYARELREPAAKPGESAFGIMRAVVPLLQRVDTTRVTDKWTAPRRPAGAAEGAAARVVRAFYDLINRKRVAEAMEYFAEVRPQPATARRLSQRRETSRKPSSETDAGRPRGAPTRTSTSRKVIPGRRRSGS